MKPPSRLSPYAEAFLRLIYPAYCGACAALLELHESGVCRSCRSRLARLRQNPEEAALRGRFDHLDEGWALYRYESPVKEMLSAIKFLRKRWLLRVFHEEIRSLALAITAETSYDAVVPIPLDRKKLLEREFNQAELVAALVSRMTRIPLRGRLLRKPRGTAAQSLLSRAGRLANLYGAYEAGLRKKIQGRNILLVDDIVTTGATAEEAARTLKAAGAGRVDFFALARTSRS